MEYRTACMINFFGTEEASVQFKTDAPNDQRRFAEHLLFAMFSIRQLHNLGKKNKAAKSLAETLYSEFGSLHSASEVEAYCIAELKATRTDPGEKQFAGDLTFGNGRAHFQLHTSGFGFLGIGVNYYASQSVLVLLNFLADQNSNDQGYLEKIFFIASKCGELHLARRISSINQSQLALSLTLESTSK